MLPQSKVAVQRAEEKNNGEQRKGNTYAFNSGMLEQRLERSTGSYEIGRIEVSPNEEGKDSRYPAYGYDVE
ncbi:hypothetical protein N7490_007572 [Penicillium lividum]|nr:hypothetical protein N7490_007572 [Penicillium lividum]